jgi:glycosyltransferase involved in cell wall biosynthesis
MEHNARTKVLMLITKSNWGGAQRYVYDLATHLDKSQFDVIVVLGGNGTLVEQLTHAGIKTILLTQMQNEMSLARLHAASVELWHILQKEQPDVLHINSSLAGITGAIVGRLVGLPRIIFTAHGWAFNEDRPWWQRLILKTAHYLTVMLSHVTIAVSHAIMNQMNWPGARRRMKQIHLGRTIGAMYTKPEARTHLATFHPPLAPYMSDVWIGCIAELHVIKRLPNLIHAVSALTPHHPNLRLVIIGEGGERAHLTELITTHKRTTQVFLTGAITEAARFLKAFDCFVLPSKSESYGYVLHEAGLAAVPVVATHVGGIPDVVTHNTTGILVPPDNITALAGAIDTVLTHRKESHERALLHHKTMSARTVEKMAAATSALYTLPLTHQ